MKTFRQIIAEVAQPSAGDEINFKEKHVIDHILDPNAEEDQFTADEIEKFYNRADYKKGEDMAVYEGVTLARRDVPGQEDTDIDNDGDSDMKDAQLRYRRHAQIKNKIIDESVEELVEISLEKKKDYYTKAIASKRGAGFGWKSKEGELNTKEFDRALKRGKAMSKAQDDIRSAENPVRAKVHDFSHMTDGDIYDLTQTSEKVKDGDVMKLSKGRVGVLMQAWPVITHGKSKIFHTIAKGKHISTIDKGRYKKSYEVASKHATAKEIVNEASVLDADNKRLDRNIQSAEKNDPDAFLFDGDRRRYTKGSQPPDADESYKVNEAKMTDAQMKKREEIVMSMKDNAADLKKRYGADWKSVMYAIATKQAMAEAKLDPVGKEDEDIDNDGKVTKSDAYLKARRKAIAKKLQQEGLMDVIEPVGGEYGDEEKSHVAYKKKNMKAPDHRGEPIQESDLHEVSKKTLGRYIKAAGPDRERLLKRATETSRVGHDLKAASDTKKAKELFSKAGTDVLKAANRRTGINKAVDKLAKEDVSLVKPKTGLRVFAGKTKESEIKESRFNYIEMYDGDIIEISSKDAAMLEAMFEQLDESNKALMEETMSSSVSGLNKVIKFAKEVL